MMFDEFKTKCAWLEKYNVQVRRNFEKKCGLRLTDLLREDRKKSENPGRINGKSWIELTAYWKSEEFTKKSDQGKAARASNKGGSVHTGGSLTVGAHQRLLKEKNGKNPTRVELFEHCHMKVLPNGEKVWAEPRAGLTANRYKEILEEFMLNQPIDENGNPVGPTMEQIHEMWIQASGGIVKGRVYGFGSESNFSRQISGLSGLSSSSLSSVNNEEIEMMRRKVKELTEKWSREKAKRKRVERDVRGLKDQVKNILSSGRFPIPASPLRDTSSSDDSDFEGKDSEGI